MGSSQTCSHNNRNKWRQKLIFVLNRFAGALFIPMSNVISGTVQMGNETQIKISTLSLIEVTLLYFVGIVFFSEKRKRRINRTDECVKLTRMLRIRCECIAIRAHWWETTTITNWKSRGWVRHWLNLMTTSYEIMVHSTVCEIKRKTMKTNHITSTTISRGETSEKWF